MPTLKYWDAGTNAYVQIPGISTASPSNMVATILNTPTAASSPYTIAHNMNTNNVMVQAWDTVTGDLIVVRTHISDANHIQIFFEQNCPNNVNVMVIGGVGSLAPAPVVAARMTNTATTQHLAAITWTTLIFDGIEYDTHGACTQGTGTYTVPPGQPGDYLVTGTFATTNLASGQYFSIRVVKNGAVYGIGGQPHTGAATGIATHVSTVVRCNAGDTLQLQAMAAAACDNFYGAGYQYMSVHRVFPGLQAAGAFLPTQVPPPTGFNSYTDPSGMVWVSLNGSAWKRATDVLHARVWRNAAWNATNAWAAIAYDSVQRDPMGLWVPGSASFVVPVTGLYMIMTSFAVNPVASPTVGQWVGGQILVAGSSVAVGQAHQSMGYGFGPNISSSSLVSAGQAVQVQATCTAASSVGQTGTGCFCAIDYLGTG